MAKVSVNQHIKNQRKYAQVAADGAEAHVSVSANGEQIKAATGAPGHVLRNLPGRNDKVKRPDSFRGQI